MPISTAYVLDSIDLGSGDFISQIESASFDPSVTASLLRTAGDPSPGFRSVDSVSPMIPFSTPQLATALGALSTGWAWQDLSADNTDLQFRQITHRDDRAARAASSNKRLRAADAMLTFESLRAPHRGNASGDFIVHTIYDGTNAPLIPAAGVALAGTTATDEAFGLGPVVLNSSQITGEVDLTLSTNLQMKKLSGASEPYDTFVAVESYNPVVDLTFIENNEFENIGTEGLAVTGLVFYLRKKSKHNKYVADATTEHISFTATSGLAYFTSGSGGGNQHATGTLRIEITGAIAIDTTAALP